MEFDDVLHEVRRWLGAEIVVVTWLTEIGPAEGWLNDASGRLARIDDPYGIDQPVNYVRFDDGRGIGICTIRSSQDLIVHRPALASVGCWISPARNERERDDEAGEQLDAEHAERRQGETDGQRRSFGGARGERRAERIGTAVTPGGCGVFTARTAPASSAILMRRMDLAALLRDADRDSWRTLHAHWEWGWTPSTSPLQSLPLDVPTHLVDFHATVGQTIQNSLRPLDGLAADSDGFVTICDEAQGTFEWALLDAELGDRDPPVWGRSSEPDDAWTLQSPSLSIFLVQTLIIDAVVIGLSEIGFWGDGPPDAVARMLAPMERLPWPGWTWVGESGFYAGEDTLGWVTAEDSDWPVVHVAARTLVALEPFDTADPDPFRVLGKGERVP